jgi:hypothetical protein
MSLREVSGGFRKDALVKSRKSLELGDGFVKNPQARRANPEE